MVTAPSSRGGDDFVSRYFAPWVGVDEDPVTGSSHCVLAPYWQQQLGRAQFHARQVSRRSGDLWLNMLGDRLRIAGHAVCVLRGEIDLFIAAWLTRPPSDGA